MVAEFSSLLFFVTLFFTLFHNWYLFDTCRMDYYSGRDHPFFSFFLFFSCVAFLPIHLGDFGFYSWIGWVFVSPWVAF